MTLDEKIDSAKTALHSLLTGELPKVVVDQNGERVEYNSTSVSKLRQYIAELEAEKSGCPSRPLKVWF